MFRKRNVIVALGCCLLCCSPLVVSAEEILDEETAKRCIPLRSISTTKVVDDYNILFYMRGNDIYRNQLPHRCPGLRNERAFMYRTSLSQLCDLDIITVLNDYGFGFTPGPSCGLGRFYPITKEEAKALQKAPRKI
ncbi:MAG: hypothetical protein OER85_19325, partial [Gammaproteobacteria bacterium]|nr:hypothetical protein [Gammaproteobacteria bacterium]